MKQLNKTIRKDKQIMNYDYYMEFGLKWIKVTYNYFRSHNGNKRVMIGNELIAEYTD